MGIERFNESACLELIAGMRAETARILEEKRRKIESDAELEDQWDYGGGEGGGPHSLIVPAAIFLVAVGFAVGVIASHL
jgi:hypothetical protein